MAGLVLAPDGRDWGVSFSVFYWTVDALAAGFRPPDLAARLREISQYNLGSLNVGSLPDAQQHDLTIAVRDLPNIARNAIENAGSRSSSARRSPKPRTTCRAFRGVRGLLPVGLPRTGTSEAGFESIETGFPVSPADWHQRRAVRSGALTGALAMVRAVSVRGKLWRRT
jgi:hypothetical protein